MNEEMASSRSLNAASGSQDIVLPGRGQPEADQTDTMKRRPDVIGDPINQVAPPMPMPNSPRMPTWLADAHLNEEVEPAAEPAACAAGGSAAAAIVVCHRRGFEVDFDDPPLQDVAAAAAT